VLIEKGRIEDEEIIWRGFGAYADDEDDVVVFESCCYFYY
jgi:hypothetical protein